jgi:hypothetical protein
MPNMKPAPFCLIGTASVFKKPVANPEFEEIEFLVGTPHGPALPVAERIPLNVSLDPRGASVSIMSSCSARAACNG